MLFARACEGHILGIRLLEANRVDPRQRVRRIATALLAVVVLGWITTSTFAQTEESSQPAESSDSEERQAPDRVDVEPVARDDQIASRLTKILLATDWFVDPEVRVDQGVVFLSGSAKTQEYREWAGKLAGNTQDVVAVANNMDVISLSPWDFSPARQEFRTLRRNAIQALPAMVTAISLLVISWILARLAAMLARRVASRRTTNSLLREVIAKAMAVLVLLVGIYLALRVSGLTRLAATVLGGTGLIGLFLGIAFRDIAENFLASILLSMQRPFRRGDLIIVADHKGFVQSVTTRGTTIMTLDGDHVQIPNSTIYKSVIQNVTANPHQRQCFTVGIDYEDPLEEVQAVILAVLQEHTAVLKDPEPLVLVDELAASTVNLQVFFWLDIVKHSGPKVRSSLIRLVKNELVEHGFTLPDESREVIFPKGIPVSIIEAKETEQKPLPTSPTKSPSKEVSTRAEGSLASDAPEIEQQARYSRLTEAGENLIE